MLTMATYEVQPMRSMTEANRFAAPARGGALLAQLWRASPPLTAVGTLMVVVAAASAVGIAADPRIITGAPAWLKPFKFAVSTAVYSLTLAWIYGWLTDWPRVRRVVGWTTAIVFVLEVAIIDAQAWRGTTSHFNVATKLDATLFIVMGGAILLQTFVSIAVAVALWRQRFTDRALGWALRLGMTITIAGALTGPLMTRPTAAAARGRARRIAHDDLRARTRSADRTAVPACPSQGGAGSTATCACRTSSACTRSRRSRSSPSACGAGAGPRPCASGSCSLRRPATRHFPAADLARAARTEHRRARCGGARVDGDLGRADDGRVRLDRHDRISASTSERQIERGSRDQHRDNHPADGEAAEILAVRAPARPPAPRRRCSRLTSSSGWRSALASPSSLDVCSRSKKIVDLPLPARAPSAG